MNEENSLWMGDITPWMNEEIISTFFKSYNFYPLNIKLIKDKKTNTNRNYCFIFFKSNSEANNALNQLNGKPILNSSNIFKLNWASYHSPKNKTIFVGNLNKSIDEDVLLTFFKTFYKSANKANIIRENGISKGYGFVAFKNENEYKKSLEEMNGQLIHGMSIIVREHKKKDEKNNKNDNNNDLLSNKTNNIKNNNNIISNKYENKNIYSNNLTPNLINNISRNNNTMNQFSNNFNNNIININTNNWNQINNNNFNINININNKKFLNNNLNVNNIHENQNFCFDKKSNLFHNPLFMEVNNNKNKINNNLNNNSKNISNLNNISNINNISNTSGVSETNNISNINNINSNLIYNNPKSYNEYSESKDSLNKEINNNIIEKRNKNSYQLKKLKILEIIDEKTLIKEIINSINRAFNNYKILCENNGNKIKSKYIFSNKYLFY